MLQTLESLPVDQKIQLVESLWDSISQHNSSITEEQKRELDTRLNAYAIDGNKGKSSNIIFSEIKNNL
ncbi:hypothetical protein SPBRAN_1689 [uncultured Candidatus Thioglobus sp.]|nr:hypothetical protein SPBRAN_1689 [uncultured Candidatus Thioglobus sp.]